MSSQSKAVRCGEGAESVLLYGVGLVSAVVAGMEYAFGFAAHPLAVLAVFSVSFMVLLLVCVAACWLSTLAVSYDRPCEEHNPLYRFWANRIIELVTQALRIRLHVSGEQCLPQEKFLLVSNHRSALDPLLQMGVLKAWHTGFVAKRELFRIPVIGKLMHRCFCLALDRGKPRDEAKTILRAAKLVKEQKATMGIYPEGTRNATDELLPFKNGAFQIAIRAKSPIVVAVIRNTELVTKRTPWRSTDVYLDFVGCIPAHEIQGKSSIAIGGLVRQMMERKLQEVAR